MNMNNLMLESLGYSTVINNQLESAIARAKRAGYRMNAFHAIGNMVYEADGQALIEVATVTRAEDVVRILCTEVCATTSCEQGEEIDPMHA